MTPRDIKDFAYASFTFAGVLSLYALPMVAVLSMPELRADTIVHTAPPVREAVFHLPLPVPEVEIAEIAEIVEAPEAVADENINLDNTDHNADHNIEPPPEPENINLEAPAPAASQAEVPKKSKKRRRRRNRYANCQDNENIAATDGGFSVGREVVDHYAHITRYRELGHVSWHKDAEGERDGFKLRRINCDLREAGIRNGDVVTSVNGQTVQTIPQGIRLWFKVRRKSEIVLEIIRRGQLIRINYELS